MVTAVDAGFFAHVALELANQSESTRFLERVAAFAAHATGRSGASASLSGPNGLRLSASTNGVAAASENAQEVEGEGPALLSAATGTTVFVDDTADDDRFPLWSLGVRGLPFSRVIAVPIGVNADSYGAITVFAPRAAPFSPDDVDVLETLGVLAAVAFARIRTERQLREAVESRHTIGLAQGILMERFSLDPERAFAVMRRYSQDGNVKLIEVARRVVSTRSLPDSQ
jgi:GAF domain-containing protein